MSKEYWFPWSPARFRADTMHLTAEQDGIYRRLIDHYMETGLPLQDNDAALARIAGITGDSWSMAAAIIRPFFRQSDGKLFLKRCDEIIADQTARSRKNAEKGRAGASKRWRSNVDIPEENSSSHDSAIADESPRDSTIQDKTLQDIRDNPPTPLQADRSRLVFELPEEWLREAANEMGWSEKIIRDIWKNFGAHYRHAVGQKAFRTPDEWLACWLTWCRKENIKPGAKAAGQANDSTVERTPEDQAKYDAEQRKWHRKMGMQHSIYNPEGIREEVA